MDALLTRNARQAVEAAVLGGRRAAGLLLGHKRGGRFLVDRIAPSGPGAFPGLKEYLRLSSILGEDIVGFFSTSPAVDVRRKSPPPFSTGKLFLSVRAGRNGKLVSRAFVLDYAGRWVWKTLKIVSSP